MNFQCYEVSGTPLFRAKAGIEVKSVEDIDLETTIGKNNPLNVGDVVYIQVLHMFGGGFASATIKRNKYGELYGDGINNVYDIKFANDSRQCWVSSSAMNKACLK